jgi:serine/threonine protein kinase
MNDASPHLDAEQLRRLFLGQLPEVEVERCAVHLDSCAFCLGALPAQAPTDTFLGALLGTLGTEPHAEEAECGRMLARLEQMPATATLPTQAVDTTAPPAEAPTDEIFGSLPRAFGRYSVIRRLGAGGMGAVYLAEDPVLERPVALKVAHFQGPDGSVAAQRFLREARAAASLQHEGLCRVLDCGECEGISYYTMEYIEGRPLSQLVEKGRPLPPRQAAELVRQVALALDEAHRRGVVHRDLKPSNIMLDGQDRPKVVDFGLARRDSDSTLTEAGALAGTLPYMSPEQVNGKPAGPASDLYSLGVILYRLLTGRLTFEGLTRADLIYHIAHVAPERPSRWHPGLDRRLEAICWKALAKAETERFSSMGAMAAALDEYLDSATAATQDFAPAPPSQPVGEPAPAVESSGLRTSYSARWWLLRCLPVVAILAVILFGFYRYREPSQVLAPSGDPLPPFKGWVDVRVWQQLQVEPRAPRRQGLKLRDSNALPLTPKDCIRIEAQLNRPGYLYLFWIDSEGKAIPVYPWEPNQWENRPPKEEAVSNLSLPPELDKCWDMQPGKSGMETLLLLVRETPWTHQDIRGMLSGLPRQKEQNLQAAVWFENWEVDRSDAERAPNFFNQSRNGDAVMETQRLLRERLHDQCAYSRAVSFASKGE